MFGRKKKLDRKMRRRIRKTSAVMLLISAITVAAIPVPEAAAANGDGGIVAYADDYDAAGSSEGSITFETAPDGGTSRIPKIIPRDENANTGDVIYCSANSGFQYAYKNIDAFGGDVAVLLRATTVNINNGEVAIPDYLEAYVQYTNSQGTNRGYTAANKYGKPLFYREITEYTYTRTSTRDLSDDELSNPDIIPANAWGNWSTPTITTPYVEDESTSVTLTAQVETTTSRDPNTQRGSATQTYHCYTYRFRPCFEDDISKWHPAGKTIVYYLQNQGVKPEVVENNIYYKLPTQSIKGEVPISLENMFEDAKWRDSYTQTTSDNTLLERVKVACISNQRVTWQEGATAGSGKWTLMPDDAYLTENFFANASSITKISLPDTLYGIAPYTFYRCSALQSVSFSENSLISEIGPSAFEGCSSMQNFTLPPTKGIAVISENTFKDCRSLSNFVVPIATKTICDSAFSGCTALASFTFAEPSNVEKFGRTVFENCRELVEITLPEKIDNLGQGTFKNCSKLERVTLPNNPNLEKIRFSAFAGCTNLKYIDVLHDNTTFDLGDYAYNAETFKEEVGDEFYFIGKNEQSGIHNVTKEKEIAFKYRDTGVYEKIVHDPENDKNIFTYQVNPDGKLVGLGIQGTPKNVVIESKVGPYPITSVGSEFSDSGFGNDNLETITIPNTITTIGDNAFRGCKNLKKVIFQETNNIVSIGKDAFFTQFESDLKDPTPLTFVGNIDVNSVPFQYAMAKENTYNNSSQQVSYIDFCSGNPTNIHVMYDAKTDKRMVHKIPEATNVMAGIYKEEDEYYQSLKTALIDTKKYTNTDGTVNTTAIDDRIKEIVNAYKDTGAEPNDSPDVLNAFRSAFNITLPTGIQRIKPGLFSYADAENTVKKDAKDDAGNEIGVEENAKRTAEELEAAARGKLNTYVKSITMHDIESLDDYTFYGCKNLESAVMYSSGVEGGESIGDYAFGQCEKLKSVTVPTTTNEMGVRPFADDKDVTTLYFTGEWRQGVTPGTSNLGNNFSCERGIIYKSADGQKEAVVQCLIDRGGTTGSPLVGPDELIGIKSIYPEAFMDCDKIITVDLSKTNVGTIPEFCFANASELIQLYLPWDCSGLEDYSLKDTNLTVLRVPNDNVRFDSNRIFYSNKEYENKPNVDHVLHNVTVISPEGSSAEKLASANKKYGWVISDDVILPIYTITFVDDDEKTVIATRMVELGEDVEPPTEEEFAPFKEKHEAEGKYFDRWFPSTYTPAAKNMTVQAVYGDTPPQTWKVRFVNDDLKLIVEREVRHGEAAEEPKTPTSYRGTQYKFTGWISVPEDDSIDNIPMNNITGNVMFMASYDYTGSTSGNDPNGGDNNGGDNNGGNNNGDNNGGNNNGGDNNGGNNNGGDNNGGNNNGGDNNGGNNNGNNNNNSNQTLYTLTVVNGSGSGSYAADTMVTVAAYTPNTGYEFYNWTSSENDTAFTTKTLAATAFKMPAKNLTVTANYRTKTETGNSITSRRSPGTITSAPSSNTGSVSKGNSSNSNSNDNSGNSGSSVQVNRPGISNTDVASATVNGSTDNFVVKVTEDGQATAAVAEALRNEYGDLANIRYFAMDISLYDETGTTKITDTSGLSVTITLPIPDELRQYAGNNKVAAVTGGNNLDKLNPRFTTVNGVPCVTFTATHFSPYTIYVDTANLSEGAFDSTPKTGDAIHPKWFLAIGLGLFSAVLFLKKDKKVKLNAA